jgi:hypothetical protein
MKKRKAAVPVISIENKIYSFRGQNVMLDSDLAELYGVETRVLVQAMKRNLDRFPSDFMFRLSSEEVQSLRSQFATSESESKTLRSQNVTSKKGRGGRRYPPYAFTEHGAVMLASVLNSKRAVEASIFVVRAFVRMRAILSVHKEFARKLSELERRITGHDEDIKTLIKAIKQLIHPSVKPKKQIGFKRTD